MKHFTMQHWKGLLEFDKLPPGPVPFVERLDRALEANLTTGAFFRRVYPPSTVSPMSSFSARTFNPTDMNTPVASRATIPA